MSDDGRRYSDLIRFMPGYRPPERPPERPREVPPVVVHRPPVFVPLLAPPPPVKAPRRVEERPLRITSARDLASVLATMSPADVIRFRFDGFTGFIEKRIPYIEEMVTGRYLAGAPEFYVTEKVEQVTIPARRVRRAYDFPLRVLGKGVELVQAGPPRWVYEFTEPAETKTRAKVAKRTDPHTAAQVAIALNPSEFVLLKAVY
jgi:hypothetical protein